MYLTGREAPCLRSGSSGAGSSLAPRSVAEKKLSARGLLIEMVHISSGFIPLSDHDLPSGTVGQRRTMGAGGHEAPRQSLPGR